MLGNNFDAEQELEKLDQEIENLTNEKVFKENSLKQMQHDYMIYLKNLAIRETKLREYIRSTNVNLLKTDKSEQKTVRETLKKEVLTGVEKIPLSIRQSIRVKKKELDNKIKIKLLDMDYKHQIAYGEVIKNHNSILASAKQIEDEYVHMSDNQERATNKLQRLKEENEEYINRRTEIKKKILKTKRDYMNMKRIVNMINDAIDEKNKKEKEKQEKVAVRKETHGLGTLKSSIKPKITSLRKSVSPNKNLLRKFTEISAGVDLLKDKEKDKDDFGLGLGSKISNNTRKFVVLDVNNILKIAESMIQKNPKFKSTIISYANILNNNYNRLLKLRELYISEEAKKNEVQKRVFFILYKLKEISLQHNYLQLKFLDIGGIYMNKEDRAKLITFLVTDDIINNIYKTSKFPAINTIERKIYTAKT